MIERVVPVVQVEPLTQKWAKPKDVGLYFGLSTSTVRRYFEKMRRLDDYTEDYIAKEGLVLIRLDGFERFMKSIKF